MYKFKTTEQTNDKATEFETKSLLYLLTKIKGCSGISLFIIDCFNDVTGMSLQEASMRQQAKPVCIHVALDWAGKPIRNCY